MSEQATQPTGFTFDVIADDMRWFEISVTQHPDWSRAQEGWTAPLRWTWGIYQKTHRFGSSGDPVTKTATYHDTRDEAYAEAMAALLIVLGVAVAPSLPGVAVREEIAP